MKMICDLKELGIIYNNIILAIFWIIDSRRGASLNLELPPATLLDRMEKLEIRKPSNYWMF